MSFSNLKKNRDKVSKLLQEAEKSQGGKKNFGDDRFWKPTVDKAGNGYAVIRFLPEAKDNPLPWVQYWDHGFQGPTGQWYIEKSLTSIGQPDPVAEFNGILWNTGLEEDKETARKQKRRLHYVSNIYVVSDSGNPDNDGKVFMFQYGKKIFDKIMDAMQPQFADEEPINPFDFWEGANFKLKIRQVEGYRNYDKSEFGKVEALSDQDDVLEGIYNQMYDLREFTDAANYKSYDELKDRLNRVLNLTASAETRREAAGLDEEAPPRQQREAKAPVEKAETTEEDDDDNLSYFSQLANDD